MSEWLHKDNEHMENLRKYCKGVLESGDGMQLFKEYEQDIKSVRLGEVAALVDWMVRCGEYPIETIKNALNRIINIFSSTLMELHTDNSEKNRFIRILLDENRAVTGRMNLLKERLKAFSRAAEGSEEYHDARLALKQDIESLSALEAHYVKKENILFPYVEKYIPEYRCIHVMWSIHDDVRRGIKNISALLDSEKVDGILFNRAVGRLFFDIYGLIFREDYILLPLSADKIPSEMTDEMLAQCPAEGYTFIDAPDLSAVSAKPSGLIDGIIDLETGKLTAEQLVMMLNTLPVDITFVDENDCVRYFSSPQHRIFPRSKAIIGRSVQNCHPPESVHIVNEVVERLKSGKKNVESFWIQTGGKFVLIQYFALRDAEGGYRGTIEVSQEISGLRELKGEKRLLDFESQSI